MRRASTFFVAILILSFVGACGDDDVASPCTTCAKPPSPPRSLDQIHEGIERSLSERSFAAYDLLLGEDFVFYFWAGDFYEEFPISSWGRAEELETMESILVTPPDPALAIESIEFTRLETVETWGDEIQNPELLDADWVSVVRVQLVVAFADDTVDVAGRWRIYVEEHEDEDGAYFTIRAWEDLGPALLRQDEDASSWGSFKARF